MLDFFDQFASFVHSLVENGGYLGIFLVAFLESSFNPLPSELVFPFVGFVAATGAFDLLGAVLVGAVGATAGAVFLYGIGFILGRANLKLYVDRYGKYLRIHFDDIEKAERWFEKYAGAAVFFGRMIPVVRTLISLPAGFVRMNIFKFGFYTFLGSFLWIGALTTGGYLLGERWESLVPFFVNYNLIFAIFLIALGAFLFIRFYRQHGRRHDQR